MAHNNTTRLISPLLKQGALRRFFGNSLIIQNNGSTVINLNSAEANIIQNAITKIRLEKDSEDAPGCMQKVFMRWANTSFLDSQKVIPDKVIIDRIYPEPRKVIFAKNSDKSLVTNYDQRFPQVNWQNLVYVVDVEVSFKNQKPIAYRVTKVYTEETFDPEDI